MGGRRTPGAPPPRTRILRALLQYLRDPAVAAWRKWVGVLAVAYTVWPFDFVPDAIPVLGWLDDAGVLAVTAAFLVREVRRHAALREGTPADEGDSPGP